MLVKLDVLIARPKYAVRVARILLMYHMYQQMQTVATSDCIAMIPSANTFNREHSIEIKAAREYTLT